jgi:hypothetical protein
MDAHMRYLPSLWRSGGAVSLNDTAYARNNLKSKTHEGSRLLQTTARQLPHCIASRCFTFLSLPTLNISLLCGEDDILAVNLGYVWPSKMLSQTTPAPSPTSSKDPYPTTSTASPITIFTLRVPFREPDDLSLLNATTIHTTTDWIAQIWGGSDIVTFRDVVTAVDYSWTVIGSALSENLTEHYTCQGNSLILTWCSSSTAYFRGGSIDSASGTSYRSGKSVDTLTTVTAEVGRLMHRMETPTPTHIDWLPTPTTTTSTLCLLLPLNSLIAN